MKNHFSGILVPLLVMHCSSAALPAAAVENNASLAPSPSPSSTLLSEGIQSSYTPLLIQALKRWPPREIPTVTPEKPYWFRPIRTPQSSDTIGMVKRMWVSVSPEKLAAVFDDFQNYTQLFSGLVEVKVVQKEGNRLTTAWERETPVFFIPNVRDQVFYDVDRSNPQRITYRYQLKKSNTLRSSDGILVLESQGSGTQFTAFDFFNADWGIAKSVAGDRIWMDSIKGTVISDLSVKLRAEQSALSYAEIRKQAETLAQPYFPNSLKAQVFFERWDFPSLSAQ